MTPHTLALTKRDQAISAKRLSTISYQTGVDVLGFPIYVQHKIYKIQATPNSKFHRGISVPIDQVVEQKIIIQH